MSLEHLGEDVGRDRTALSREDTGDLGLDNQLVILFAVDGLIKQQIVTAADAGQLRQLAVQQKMTSLRDHGKQLVLEGITTPAEVWRVTREMEAT